MSTNLLMQAMRFLPEIGLVELDSVSFYLFMTLCTVLETPQPVSKCFAAVFGSLEHYNVIPPTGFSHKSLISMKQSESLLQISNIIVSMDHTKFPILHEYLFSSQAEI